MSKSGVLRFFSIKLGKPSRFLQSAQAENSYNPTLFIVLFLVNSLYLFAQTPSVSLDEKLESALERRIQQAKSFKIGNTVPNIVMKDETGKTIDLQKLNSERVLIVFYSTTCPHCTELLPELHNFYKTKSNKNFEVLAISLDEDKSAWQNYIKANNFDWINVNDTDGWSSKAATDYYIYATPTMFLVDKNMKLVEIPRTIPELKE